MLSAIKHQSNILWLVTHLISSQNIFHFCDCCITHCSLVMSCGIRYLTLVKAWLITWWAMSWANLQNVAILLRVSCATLLIKTTHRFDFTKLLCTVYPTRYKYYLVLLWCIVFTLYFYYPLWIYLTCLPYILLMFHWHWDSCLIAPVQASLKDMGNPDQYQTITNHNETWTLHVFL